MKIPTQKIQICVGIFLQHYTFLQKRTFSILCENFSRFVRKATIISVIKIWCFLKYIFKSLICTPLFRMNTNDVIKYYNLKQNAIDIDKVQLSIEL